MDYHDRHVVVTGGTGALGTAMVGALLDAGAVCHVPYINAAEADRFAYRDNAKVSSMSATSLTFALSRYAKRSASAALM